MKAIVVSGAVANKPFNGGNAWAVMSWLSGLRRLGWEVYFIEEIDEAAWRNEKDASPEKSSSVDYFRSVVHRFAIADHSALLTKSGRSIFGLSQKDVQAVATESALLVNISGHLRNHDLLSRFGRRAFIDFDPGYTQFWHASGFDVGLAGHEYFFTLAASIGSTGCCLPQGDIEWRPIRQPVVLDDWPICPRPSRMRFSTVASWRGAYGRVEHEGRSYGQKAHSFRKIASLPRNIAAGDFELALDIHPADADDSNRLLQNGWRLVDPVAACGTPDGFRSYVQGSAAEVSAAQEIYVQTGSGWFSDRSVRYLASGRPVILEDTGFRSQIPVGEGLLAFRNLPDLIHKVDDVISGYDRHARAARQVAEEFFDSNIVMTKFLEEVDL